MSVDPHLRAAIDELRSLRSSDPCAAIAVTTVKATVHTLETHWQADGPSARHRTGPHSPDGP